MDKLIQGKYYHISLVSPYSIAGEYDVYVSAIARKATLHLYGDFDIRNTFFTPAGIGIRRYLETVKDDTDIFICHKISSTEPITVDEKDFTFIPTTIIDYNNIKEYITATRFQLNIEGIRRRFNNDEEKSNFLNKLENDIVHTLNKETILANDILSISDSQKDHLVLEESIIKEEQERDAYIKSRENAITDKLKAESDRELEYYKKVKDLNAKEAVYNENIANINTLISQAEISKNIGSNFLANVNDLMTKIRELYNQFDRYAKNYGYPIPEWDNLFRMVYKSHDGDTGISTDEWIEMLAQMAQGVIPDELQNVEIGNCPLCGTDVNKIIEMEKRSIIEDY